MGFIFQFFNLLKELTALENVMLPMLIRGRKATWNREQGQTIVMVTHEQEWGAKTNRIINLLDGKVI